MWTSPTLVLKEVLPLLQSQVQPLQTLLIPSHPVSFENFSPLIFSFSLYFYLLLFQYMLHNLWGTIFLGDNVFAAQAPVSTGPLLLAHKHICFPLVLIKKIPEPNFLLKLQPQAPSFPSLPNFLKEYSKCAASTSSFTSAHCHLAGIPPHNSVETAQSTVSQYILTAKSKGFFQHSSIPASLIALRLLMRVTHAFILENLWFLGFGNTIFLFLFPHCSDCSFSGFSLSAQFLNLDILNSFFFFHFKAVLQTMAATMGQIEPVTWFYK